MTNKKYPKPLRVSRSPRPPSPPRPRTASRPPTPPPSTIRPPAADHFGLLHPETGEHPVDAMVDHIPAIAARDRRLMRLAAKVQRSCADDALFLRHEDLRLHQQTEREEIYYSTGFEHGHLAGRAASLDARASATPAARAFHNRLQVLLTTSHQAENVAAVVMLEFSRALVLKTSPGRRS
jgi:hypothetical protein